MMPGSIELCVTPPDAWAPPLPHVSRLCQPGPHLLQQRGFAGPVSTGSTVPFGRWIHAKGKVAIPKMVLWDSQPTEQPPAGHLKERLWCCVCSNRLETRAFAPAASSSSQQWLSRIKAPLKHELKSWVSPFTSTGQAQIHRQKEETQ